MNRVALCTMVIHEDFEAPVEAPITKKSALQVPKNYITIKNHIREITFSDDSNKKVSETANHNKKNVEKKALKQIHKSQMSSHESTSYFNEESSSELNKSDLEELINVYRKCKRILKKIENKYGHLLNLNDDETTGTESENDTKKRKRKSNVTHVDEDVETETQCTCDMKKKIVFDENGEQIQLSPSKFHHICFKNLQSYCDDNITVTDSKNTKDEGNETINSNKTTDNLELDCEESDSMPDDVASLSRLLQNDEINISHRKKIIHKIKMLTQEQNYELQLSKQTIIKQLKENPEDVMEFKGSNLFSLSGYL